MSFGFVKQHDSMQCGIACLQMVCKHYGKEYSLDTLSRHCFATTEGVSLLSIGQHTVEGRGERDYEQIELRSEKVRNIIGRVPPLPIRWGISIIAMVLAMLAGVAYWVVGKY